MTDSGTLLSKIRIMMNSIYLVIRYIQRIFVINVTFLLPFLFTTIAKSQTIKSFEIDKITGFAKSELPFDVPFVVTIKGVNDKESIETIYVFEAYIYDNDRHLRKKGYEGKISHIQKLEFKVIKDDLIMYFDPLLPNMYIDIAIVRDFTGAKLKSLHSINAEILAGNLVKAQTKYNNLTSAANLEPQGYSTPRTFYTFNWDDYKSFFQSSLRLHYESSADATNLLITINLSFDELAKLIRISDDVKLGSPELSNLFQIFQQNLVDQVLNGTLAIDGNYLTKPAGIYELDKRIENYKKSIQLLKTIIIHSNNLIAKSPSDDVFIKKKINEMDVMRAKLIANLFLVQTELQSIKTSVKAETKLRYGDWVMGGNKFQSIKSAGTAALIPDFGIASVFAFSPIEGQNRFFARPYAGASIYVRPINKNQRFNEIPNPTLWHRMSFNVGLTLGAIKEEEFEDFFKSMSLLLGANYRITKELRLSTGAALLRQKHPNPLIGDTRIDLGAYIGVSIDVDLVGSISNVTKKVF